MALQFGSVDITASDARLKKKVQTIQSSLEIISKLRPVSYEFFNELGTKQFGFIAQEAVEVDSNLATHGEFKTELCPDGMWRFEYNNMHALLTKAVQELKEENDSLKKRLEILQSKVK